jgi:hypothetical protein
VKKVDHLAVEVVEDLGGAWWLGEQHRGRAGERLDVGAARWQEAFDPRRQAGLGAVVVGRGQHLVKDLVDEPQRGADSHRLTSRLPYRDEDAVAVEVAAGSVVLFNGYLLHRSLPNTGCHGLRRALVNHYMSAESLLPWFLPPAGVSIGRADHRDVVLVAGTDPYAHKGSPT